MTDDPLTDEQLAALAAKPPLTPQRIAELRAFAARAQLGRPPGPRRPLPDDVYLRLRTRMIARMLVGRMRAR